MSNKLFLLPLSVHDAAEGLAKVAAEVAPGTQVQFVVGTDISNLLIRVNSNGERVSGEPDFRQFIKETAIRPELPCSSASLVCASQPSFKLEYKDENGLKFFSIEQVASRETAFALVDSLRKHFNLSSRAAVVAASLPPHEREVLQFKEQAVSDLTAQVSRLGEFLTQMAEKNAETVRNLTGDLQRQFQDKQAELDGQVRKQKEALDAERREFEKAKAEFDDRQRTHVRRALLEKIETNIGSRAKATPITKGASRSRTLIHLISWLFIVASAVGGFFAGAKLYAEAGHIPFDWRVVPPFSIAALLFAATIVFYFRWTSQWADRLALNDLAIQQYASDILRASWIVELLFEYKEEKEKEIPREVIGSLAEGLFKREQFKGAKYHPSDDLSSLLRRLQSLKAGPEGLEITAAGNGRR